MKRSRRVLMIFAIGIALAVVIPNHLPRFRPPAQSNSVYGFDRRAEKLWLLFFPQEIKPNAELTGYTNRNIIPRFHSLNQVLAYYNQQSRVAQYPASSMAFGCDNMESRWLCIDGSAKFAARLLRSDRTTKITELAAELASSPPRFPSLILKMLFQHDVYEMFCTYNAAVQKAAVPELARRGAAAATVLARLLGRILFSRTDFIALRSLRPTMIARLYFDPNCDFDLSEDYMPQRVLKPAAGWHEIPFISRPPAHFVYFQGRTLVHVYIKVPDWTRQKVWDYWRKLYSYAGDIPNQFSSDPPLPAKTQVLLVRTIGVFTRNLRFVDTGFPEEVLIRLFKYEYQRLDPTTSDFRGTLFYQYELHRRLLTERPGSLGLQRVMDHAPSFLGFTPAAPDLLNAQSADLTTMQFNCIGCHELQLYGAGTVFSFAHKPPTAAQLAGARIYGGLLERTKKPGVFRNFTPNALTLIRMLRKAGIRRNPAR